MSTATITHHIALLQQVIISRIRYHLGQDAATPVEVPFLPLPENGSGRDYYAGFLEEHELSFPEHIILLLALVPHLRAGYFETIMQELFPKGGDFPELGGVKGNNHRGMLPTGETAQFIIAGNDISGRLAVEQFLDDRHFFYRESLLLLEAVREGEPRMSGRLLAAPEFLEHITTGAARPPRFSPDFPAKRVETKQAWADLVLPPSTMTQLDDLRAWLRHHPEVMQDPVLGRKINSGYRVLFWGPSGAGKTFAATLIGQEFGKEVYRIDLSQVVSKYVGETEKNLERIFQKAENKDWILFFDEADALFGKRSNVQSAHDKYANQEVSYLLQRVEDFPGMVILASNFKSNIDKAFLRRFNTIIEFPMPGPAERLQLWVNAMPGSIPVAADVDLKNLADKFELTGSDINHVMHDAALQMYYRNMDAITVALLSKGIKKELKKDDKLIK